MKFTLATLFFQGIHPFEEIVPQDSEYRAIQRQIAEERRYLMQSMSAQDAQRLEGLAELYLRSGSLYACDCFAYGLRLGVALMDEMRTGEEQPDASQPNG